MGVHHLRWIGVGIAVAFLLLGAAQGSLFAVAAANPLAQAPVPPATVGAQPVLRPAGPVLPTPTPTPSTPLTVSNALTGAQTLTGSTGVSVTSAPTYYIVLPGDTLFVIARDHGTTLEAVMAANGIRNPDILHVGQVLIIPGADGARPDPALLPVAVAQAGTDAPVIVPRGTITERMTTLAQAAGPGSPFHGTTWLTYYGRPGIPVMGILGEHSVEDLTPLLAAEAEAYDAANGDALGVMPALHLVYGMATKAAGEDGSHLAFIEESTVITYIQAAEAEGWSVILDVQIGALSPTAAITPALRYLEYPNVHLAIDPEFAMVHPGQAWPGNPIGYVTAEQINQVQAVINTYLIAKRLPGPRVLLVHQFQSSMIVEPEQIDAQTYADKVALTLSVDGWGGPWGKISKYNSFITPDSPFAAFKLFYRWDEPLLTPDVALGNLPHTGTDFFMDVTPNLIIYQ